MNKWDTIGLAVGSVLILVLAACIPGQPAASPTLHIGVRTANDHVPFYIADKQQLYAAESLDATVQLIPSNTEIIEAIQRGDLQMGAAPVTTAIAAIAQGTQIKIVAMTGRGSDGLLVHADSGIATLADLRGKKIATIRGSILDVPLRAALADAGLDPEQDVTLVYFSKLGDMISALKTGQVDASSNTEPFMTEAESAGWGRIMLYYTAYWPDHPCCVVFCRDDYAKAHPGAVEKALRVHVHAVDWANAHPHDTAEIIVEYMGGSFQVPTVEASLATDKMHIDYDLTPDEIVRMAQLMYQYGLIDRVPTAEELVDTSYLQRAKAK
ncbi:MAG: ABC transporter substrate-binding protein [Chloroflexi bacterium]|nr:ABC transporter substrate-binding protein [Chloroflexota bacterium]MBU1749225.1 ABC transporter substrate-binding protein [Chloroflexota bacterium]